MNDQAFLAAILDAPDDDAPRLIYADWLDEQGQCERAEFIRVQCEYDQHCDPHERAPKWEALRRRAEELLGMPVGVDAGVEGLRWSNAVRWSFSGDPGWFFFFSPQFRRGFVHAITCTAEEWLRHADAILAAQPVEEVTLASWPLHGEVGGVPYWGVGFNENIRLALQARWPQIKKWILPRSPFSHPIDMDEYVYEVP